MSTVRLSCLILVLFTHRELYGAPMNTNTKPKPPSVQISMLYQVASAFRSLLGL